MNGQLRKASFSNSTNFTQNKIDFKKNINIGIFPHNIKNKLPTIIINSKNSELLGLSPSERKYSLSIIKQKSLTPSQTQNFPFRKKISCSNFNIRKQSTNTLKSEIKFNINNLNNLTPLDNNIIQKSAKIITKSIPSEEIIQSKTINYNKGFNINPLTIRKAKSPDDFAVSDEDRIFNQFKPKKNNKSHSKKKKIKMKVKLKKKKINPLASYDAALHKVYKQIPKIISKIEDTKKLKGTMSLFKYQNLLMDVGTKNLNRETREKLNNKFLTLRNFSDKTYDLLKESLENIETEEKKIIDSINTQQNYYKRKMNETKFNTTISRNMGFFSLPNLKFHQIGKPKIKHKYKYRYKKH